MDDPLIEIQNLRNAFAMHVKQNAEKFAGYDSLIAHLTSTPEGTIMADTPTTTDNVRIHNHAPAGTDPTMAAMMAMASKSGADGGLLGGSGGGLLGGLLLGTLLRNGGLFGGTGVGDANSVMQPTANMSIMATLGDIKQAVAVNAATAETSNANQSIALMQAVNASTGAAQTAIGSLKDATNSNTVALMQMINGVTQAISNDGDKTRALVTSQYETNLQRQLADANAAIVELRSDARFAAQGRATDLNITQTVNQAQAQTQQQQQFQVFNDRLGAILASHQNLQQGIVNLGTMSGAAGQQTAANTRVN